MTYGTSQHRQLSVGQRSLDRQGYNNTDHVIVEREESTQHGGRGWQTSSTTSNPSPRRRPLPSPVSPPAPRPLSMPSLFQTPPTSISTFSGTGLPTEAQLYGYSGNKPDVATLQSNTLPDFHTSRPAKKPLPRPPSVVSPTIAALSGQFTNPQRESNKSFPTIPSSVHSGRFDDEKSPIPTLPVSPSPGSRANNVASLKGDSSASFTPLWQQYRKFGNSSLDLTSTSPKRRALPIPVPRSNSNVPGPSSPSNSETSQEAFRPPARSPALLSSSIRSTNPSRSIDDQPSPISSSAFPPRSNADSNVKGPDPSSASPNSPITKPLHRSAVVPDTVSVTREPVSPKTPSPVQLRPADLSVPQSIPADIPLAVLAVEDEQAIESENIIDNSLKSPKTASSPASVPLAGEPASAASTTSALKETVNLYQRPLPSTTEHKKPAPAGARSMSQKFSVKDSFSPPSEPPIERSRPSYTTALQRPSSRSVTPVSPAPTVIPTPALTQVHTSRSPSKAAEPQSMAMRLAALALAEEAAEEERKRNERVQNIKAGAAKGAESDEESDEESDDGFGGPAVPAVGAPLIIEPDLSLLSESQTSIVNPRASRFELPPRPSSDTVLPAAPIERSPSLTPAPTISISIPVPQINLPDDETDEPEASTKPSHPRSPSITISATPSAGARVQMGGAAVSESFGAPSHTAIRPGGTIVPYGSNLRCAGCQKPIVGRIVSAMGQRWHPGCFQCSECGELLEHVSAFEHEGKPYCHLDYHERFAPHCYHCKTPIADERFITLDDPALGGQRYYHELHFFCAECGDPFLDPARSLAAPKGSVENPGSGADDEVGFTVYKGHPYCESCHVRLRMPRCGSSTTPGIRATPGKGCGRPIREGAIEALGRRWHHECFKCSSCQKPFDDPSFFQRADQAFCDPCYRIIVKSEF